MGGKCVISTFSVDNAKNLRELGGYITGKNFTTKYGKILRGDNLSKLTYTDILKMKNYGIRTIIDLRFEEQIALFPDKTSRIVEFNSYNIALNWIKSPLDVHDFITNYDTGILNNYELISTISKLYILCLESSKPQIEEVFRIIENAIQDNGVLIHCNWGKDRTGIISMLVLGSMGVQEADIISNYSCSYENIKNSYLKEKMINENDSEFIFSKPEYIKNVIDYIYKEYNSFKDFLLSCNISCASLRNIEKNFLL